MLPASMALIREQFPDAAERVRALGVWVVGGATAAAAGPLPGGVLTTLDWRWVFHLNVPVCAATLILVAGVGASPRHGSPFDWSGQALSMSGLSALVYGLIQGGSVGFAAPTVLGCLVLAVVALAGFVVVEGRVVHPMVPLELFRTVDMRISLTAGFSFMVCWYGTVFVTSRYLQQYLGLTPLWAGLAFLPSAVVSVFGNLISGPLTNGHGARVPVLIGFGAMVLGLIGLILTAPLGVPLLTAALIVPLGAGGAIAMPAVNSLVLVAVPAERAGTASAVFNTCRQIGGAVATAVFGAFIAAPGGFLPGLRASLAVAAGVAMIAVLSALGIKHRPTPSA